MNAPSLQKLHDFYQPPAPSWMPHTTAWYVLFGVMAILVLWAIVRIARARLRNRYRRAALHELVTTAPEDFSALLKRTALAAWPRESVASLTGSAWLDFLNKAAGKETFGIRPGNRIEELAVCGIRPPAKEEQQLRKIVGDWIRRHRVPA